MVGACEHLDHADLRSPANVAVGQPNVQGRVLTDDVAMTALYVMITVLIGLLLYRPCCHAQLYRTLVTLLQSW